MKTEEMICELRRLEEAHKNDFVGTCETNWSLMCHDVANRLEELLAVQKAIEPSTYDHLFICPVCKNTLFEGQKFCHECGQEMKWDD